MPDPAHQLNEIKVRICSVSKALKRSSFINVQTTRYLWHVKNQQLGAWRLENLTRRTEKYNKTWSLIQFKYMINTGLHVQGILTLLYPQRQGMSQGTSFFGAAH